MKGARAERTDPSALAGPVGALAAVALALIALRLRDPRVPGSYGLCPSVALFGWACPGCGSLRGLAALAQGDLTQAWSFNPALILAAVLLISMWADWLRRYLTRQDRRWVAPGWALYLLAAGIVSYGIARNIPDLGGYLGPLGLP